MFRLSRSISTLDRDRRALKSRQANSRENQGFSDRAMSRSRNACRWLWASALIALIGLLLPGQAAFCQANQPPVTGSQQAKVGAPEPPVAPAPPGTPNKPPTTPAEKAKDPAGPQLSLGKDGPIRIPFGATSGVAQVMVKAENLTEEQVAVATPPAFTDLGVEGTQAATKVAFENPQLVDSAAKTSRAWLWTAHVQDLPVNTSQDRYAKFVFGKLEKSLPYVLTNLTPANFTWSVLQPGAPWLAWFGLDSFQPATTIVATAGAYPATNFRLAQSTLQNSLGTAQIGLQDLEFCVDISNCDQGQPFTINPQSNRTFYVRLKDRKGQSLTQNGKYTGTLSFAVNERPELQTVNMTLNISSLLIKIAGTVALALGIFLAWWLSVRARSLLLRLEALKPVAFLRESIDALLGELDKIKDKVKPDLPDAAPTIRKKLNDIKDSLEENKLDGAGCLPPAFPSPYPGGTDTTERLKTYLADRQKVFDGLMVLVRNGMEIVMQDWDLHPNFRDKIKVALQSLDRKAESDKLDREAASTAVNEILSIYHEQTRPEADVPTRKGYFDRAASKPLNTEYIRWETGRIYLKGWWIWGIITFLGGLAVLVLNSPGFGTFLDLIFCFFWGFGLPTGLEKIQGFTPGNYATNLGLTQIK
jgi:hypothetical protein